MLAVVKGVSAPNRIGPYLLTKAHRAVWRKVGFTLWDEVDGQARASAIPKTIPLSHLQQVLLREDDSLIPLSPSVLPEGVLYWFELSNTKIDLLKYCPQLVLASRISVDNNISLGFAVSRRDISPTQNFSEVELSLLYGSETISRDINTIFVSSFNDLLEPHEDQLFFLYLLRSVGELVFVEECGKRLAPSRDLLDFCDRCYQKMAINSLKGNMKGEFYQRFGGKQWENYVLKERDDLFRKLTRDERDLASSVFSLSGSS